MPVGPSATSLEALPAIEDVREPVERTLRSFLDDRRAEVAALDPAVGALVEEIRRVVDAGGKRIRPSVCLWAYRAAGGRDLRPIIRAASAIELLHTFAVIHDDVMDDTPERRGVAATHVRFADEAAAASNADERRRHGAAVAILVGDLAAVLAEQLLRTCGASAEPLALAMARFDRMRIEMAAGQFLDLEGSAPAGRIAALKTGSYTAEGPVLIATALAEAGPAVERPLVVFARHVGEAFQLRDDVLDGDAPAEDGARVDALLDLALAALDGAPLEPGGARALASIAELLRTRATS
jgi:geranylgeranyl diphosphate synthase, type I